MNEARQLRIGTAGWSIPRAAAERFGTVGTHLERYASVFDAVEINSSFYQPHRPTTYARWRASTPPDFRFAVKVPRTITHVRRLRDARDPFVDFLDRTAGLGEKRGPVLVQLPPSLSFDPTVVATFFDMVRRVYDGPVACEPRHPTWFAARVASLLTDLHISRVAADPPPVPAAGVPDGSPDLVYVRWHGSPRMYWSAYDAQDLERLEARLRHLQTIADVWCIFDNTALGAATENAWAFRERLRLGVRV